MDFKNIGVKIPKILLPNKNVDMTKWAVVACDQYTSEPDYWKRVSELVADEPSTLKLVYPEVYLKDEDKEKRIQNINDSMSEYLEQELLEAQSNEVASAPKEKLLSEEEGIIYVERTINGKTRQGLVVALDLEYYDFSVDSKSLIRATEGTIVDRLPPRVEVRKNALIELPHIMVLIDDREKKVIEPLTSLKSDLDKVYDFELMMEGGHVKGYRLDLETSNNMLTELAKLADPVVCKDKYGQEDVLLFAMGDGNHSLATAKTIWESTKSEKGMDHPSRFALVELMNIHSEAMEFEPIHRVLFNVKKDFEIALKEEFGETLEFKECSKEEMITTVENSGDKQIFGFINLNNYKLITFNKPTSNLTYGTLQKFLDKFVSLGNAEEIDYVHGTDVVCELGQKTGNCGFFLDSIDKNSFFKSVILEGALPRKTFSMGEANEKRFYVEARKIV